MNRASSTGSPSTPLTRSRASTGQYDRDSRSFRLKEGRRPAGYAWPPPAPVPWTTRASSSPPRWSTACGTACGRGGRVSLKPARGHAVRATSVGSARGTAAEGCAPTAGPRLEAQLRLPVGQGFGQAVDQGRSVGRSLGLHGHWRQTRPKLPPITPSSRMRFRSSGTLGPAPFPNGSPIYGQCSVA